MTKQPPSPGDALKAWRELVDRNRFTPDDRPLVDTVDAFVKDRDTRSARGKTGAPVKFETGMTKRAAFTWYMTKRLIGEFPNASRAEFWNRLDRQVLRITDHEHDDRELQFKLSTGYRTMADENAGIESRQAVWEVVTHEREIVVEKQTTWDTWRKWLPKIRKEIAKGT